MTYLPAPSLLSILTHPMQQLAGEKRGEASSAIGGREGEHIGRPREQGESDGQSGVLGVVGQL